MNSAMAWGAITASGLAAAITGSGSWRDTEALPGPIRSLVSSSWSRIERYCSVEAWGAV